MIGSRSNAPFEHVYTEDPAVDYESDQLDTKKYFQTFDRKYLPIKAGASPTIFKLRPLSRKRFIAIANMAGAEQPNATVAYGIIGIENFRLPTGSMLVPEFTGLGADQHLTAATLDAIFDSRLFAELMTVIMSASGLDPLADGHSGSSPG
jgi:hypothetical protein